MSLLTTASLVVTPNAYKEGKLYSVIPSDGSGDFTFTRATTGTRVNEAGLVELVPYNLMKYSEQFDNAIYTKGNVTATANSETAPNGTLTADTITGNGSSSLHSVIQNSSIVSGTTYTTSIYAKKGTNNFVQIVGSSVIYPATVFANFDLENGVVGSLGAATTSSIESVGNGWYRCSMTATATVSATSAAFFVILIDNASSSRAEVNTLATSVYLWGAQLVEGTNALPYQKTETRLNIPRIDYSLGGCPNILLEPQRTNIALQSSSFDSATWTKSALTVTANNAISPSGVQDADLVTANGATSQHYVLQTVTAGAKTYSVFAKMGTQRYIQILTSGTAAPVANFDLQDGVANMVGSNSTASIEDFGNGWYRCILQTNDSLAENFYINYVNSLVAGRFQSILSSDTLYLWGAQAEVGSYATSYIPTTTASVTRNADTTVEKDLTSFGIGNSYTLLFDLTMATEDYNRIIFYLKNSAGADSFTFRNFSGILRVYDHIGSTYPFAAYTNESTKWAFRFDGVDYSLFRVSGGVAVKNTATLGTARNIGYLNEFITSGTKASLKLLAIEPSALTDAECEQFVIS